MRGLMAIIMEAIMELMAMAVVIIWMKNPKRADLLASKTFLVEKRKREEGKNLSERLERIRYFWILLNK